MAELIKADVLVQAKLFQPPAIRRGNMHPYCEDISPRPLPLRRGAASPLCSRRIARAARGRHRILGRPPIGLTGAVEHMPQAPRGRADTLRTAPPTTPAARPAPGHAGRTRPATRPPASGEGASRGLARCGWGGGGMGAWRGRPPSACDRLARSTVGCYVTHHSVLSKEAVMGKVVCDHLSDPVPPKLDPEIVTERLQIVAPRSLVKRISEWRKHQDPIPSASRAIRMLVEMALDLEERKYKK